MCRRAPRAERTSVDILIVDDDHETLQLLKSFLENEGHAAATADRASAALDAVQRKMPQLVLLDVLLPDRQGLEVLKILKARHPSLAVVMMTGFKEADVVLEAFRQGARDCLFKPLNLEYLKTTVIGRLAHS